MDKRLGKYRLVAELARGGMAVVWLAETRGPGGFSKHFVVKELLPNLARDEEHRAMFLDEARLAARLSHANIVETIDIDRDGDRWFMVLELLHGCSLDRARKLLAPRRMSPGMAVKIVRDLLDGLHHAHEARDDEGRPLRIVHRDVSARNVFLTTAGEVKLLDFGLAKISDRGRRTEPGMVKGSVRYLSPEHVGEVPLDRRADVFAAGILLRELLLGERLWDGLDDASVLRKVLVREIPPFPRGTDVPEQLARICEKAMAPYRIQRFATAAEMKSALDDWARGSSDVTSAEDLARLFDSDLAIERDRVRLLLRTNPPDVVTPPDVMQVGHDDDRVTLPAPPEREASVLEPSPRRRTRLVTIAAIASKSRWRPLAVGAAAAALLVAGTLVPRLVDANEHGPRVAASTGAVCATN